VSLVVAAYRDYSVSMIRPMAFRTVLGTLSFALLAACSAPATEALSTAQNLGAESPPVPPPRPFPPPPRVSATGKPAANLRTSFEAALSKAGHDAAGEGESYDVRRLDCRHRWAIEVDYGYQCSFDYRTGTGDYASVVVDTSTMAESLFDALSNAGATPFLDPSHGKFERLTNATISREASAFDDRSHYFPPPDPNISVTGDLAHAVLDALTAAEVRDQDGTVFVVCNAFDGAPKCGYWFVLRDGFGTTVGQTEVNADTSALLWTSMLNVAAATGVQSVGGGPPLSFNARSLSFDGTTLRLLLTTSSIIPPPQPTPPAVPPSR
jgi:hypothetical protein